MKKKIIIGRKDRANFPEFNLKNIDIKMDTGAYTSAIHCRDIEIKVIKGEETLFFTLLDPSHSQYDKKEYSTSNFLQRTVKNSFGASEKRFVIEISVFFIQFFFSFKIIFHKFSNIHPLRMYYLFH